MQAPQRRSKPLCLGVRRTSVAVISTAAFAASGLLVGADVAAATATAAPAVRLAATPVLRVGSTGAAVAIVQRKLQVSPATGYFGAVTKAAVMKFQRTHGIPATGVVATLTWGALNRAARPSPASLSSSAGRLPMSVGTTSRLVLSLQGKLHMSQRTGYFGSVTMAYVKAFQRAAHLRVTGVVDRKTWRKLGHVRFRAPATPTSPQAPVSNPGSGSLRSRVLAIAASLKGIPYVATGYSPSQGFNCSSMTQWVYERVGVNLGGAYTVTQYAHSRHISRSEARPGDLIFFYNYPKNFLGHVGIYAGNNMFWHAPRTGRVISKDPIYSDKVLFARVL